MPPSARARTRDPVAVAARRRRRLRWFAAIFLVLTSVQAVLVLVQATLAGRFLTGNGSALALHEAIGTEVITSVGLAQVLVAVLMWRPGWGSWIPIIISLLVFVDVTFQIGWGFERQLGLHIPNGLAIFGAQFLLATLTLRDRRARSPQQEATSF